MLCYFFVFLFPKCLGLFVTDLQFIIFPRFRVFCHWLCNHSNFGNIILCCIMFSSAMLAAENPLKANDDLNNVSSSSTELCWQDIVSCIRIMVDCTTNTTGNITVIDHCYLFCHRSVRSLYRYSINLITFSRQFSQ